MKKSFAALAALVLAAASPEYTRSGVPASGAPTATVDFTATQGQQVYGTEFGYGANTKWQAYNDPAFQAVANKYPTRFIRLWGGTGKGGFMDQIWPSSGSKPNWSGPDSFIKAINSGALTPFFDPKKGAKLMILTGYPGWADPTNSRYQKMIANLTLQVVQHFAAAGLPLWAVGPTAEVDVAHSPQAVANLNFAVAKAISGTDTVVAAPNLAYMMGDYMQASAQTMGALMGAGTWDEYASGDMWSAPAAAMNEAQGSCAHARKILDAAGVPKTAPVGIVEHNVEGDWTSANAANNGNMVAAITAAARTYAMITSGANCTVGGLWDTQNDGAYSAFGNQGSYAPAPTAEALAALTAYMPGQLVRTISTGLPTNVLVYATNSPEGQSVALINMDASTAATVNIHGLPAANQIVISGSDPMSTNCTAIRSVWPGGAVTIPAMSLVILSNKQPGATPTPNFGTSR